MNSRNIKPLEDKNVCLICQKRKATNTYNICGRGYGSDFDNVDITFQCCDECNKPQFEDWFNEACELSYNYIEEYKFEENIHKLIESLPLNSQEVLLNSSSSCVYHYMNSQDWIDYQLDELPHDKCKKYGMYSPEERQAYKDRFPTCGCVERKVYKDGSSGCGCKFGAYGNSDGSCDNYNTWTKCYMCKNYKPRVDKIKEINVTDEMMRREEARLQDMLNYVTKQLEKIKNGTYLEEE